MQYDVILFNSVWNLCFLTEINRLWDILQVFDVHSVFQFLRNAYHLLFTHAIDNHIGTGITENALAKAVFPIVVVGETAE